MSPPEPHHEMNIAILAALALTTPPSQDAPDFDVDRPEFRLDGVVYDDVDAASVWALGPDWKAEFTVEGVTFVPYLSAHAPRNLPTTFTLEEVRIAGRVVALDGATEVTRQGDRIRIDHGDVTEVYDCTPDGIEQSFVFERRDAAGEVVVRLGVESELDGADEATGLTFRGAHGGIRYGDAFAFDDRGNEAAVARVFDGHSIELTVPATFPGDSELVLDPLISSWIVSPPGDSARNPDVAFDKDLGLQGRYVIVYERIFSATDIDVLLRSFDPVTNLFSSAVAIDVSADAFENPRIAGSDATDDFYVVAAARPAGGGDRSIKGRFVEGSLFTAAGHTVNTLPGDCYQPDVGGAHVGSGDSGYVVVWSRRGLVGRGDLHSRYVDGDGVPVGSDIDVNVDWTVDDRRPRLSASTGEPVSGQPSRYNLVWERHLGTGDRRVWGARLDVNGQVARAPFAIATTGDSHSPAASVTDSDPNFGISAYPYLVSYVLGTAIGRADTMIAVCDTTGLRSTWNVSDMLDVPSSRRDSHDALVEFVGERYVLLQSLRNTSSSYDVDVSMATFDLVENGTTPGIAFATRDEEIGTNSMLAQRDLAFASEFAAGGSSDNGFGAWSIEHGLWELTTVIGGAYLSGASSNDPIGMQYCDAQPSSGSRTGWMSAYGSQAPQGQKLLLARDLPGGSFAFFIASSTPGDALFPGGSRGRLCLGGSIGRYSNQVGAAGPDGTYFRFVDPTQVSQPNGAVAAQAGETWYFQCWHRDTWGGGPTSNFTNAVAIRFR